MGLDQHVTATFNAAAPSLTQVKALIAAALIPHGKRGTIHSILNAGGYTTRLRALTAGIGRLAWYSHKRVAIATGTVTFLTAGISGVRLTLTAAGRRFLLHTHRVVLTGQATFAPRGGPSVSVTTKFTLKSR
jgi:hypothetical protein